MSDWSDDEKTPEPVRASSPPGSSRGRGRGQRDRGGGSGGGSRECYKCHEEGHVGRDCPNQPAGNENGGSRACHKCGEEGHFARDCPNAGSGGGGGGNNRACHKCGEEGHFARDCPNSGSGGGGGDRACRKCGEEGHFARECPNADNGGGGGGSSGCRKCGEEGHFARDCPKAGGGSSGCRRCGQEGHFARECPEAEGEERRPRGCYNCGEEGHIGKDCTNPRNENAARPPPRELAEGEAPREQYVPPEMPEGDEIFSARKKVYEGSGINFSKYASIAFQITGDNVAASVETFKDLGLRELVQTNVTRCGYEVPTPIQRHGSPQLMAGRHVMCCAQTGSGKTAAFLLPIINKLLQQQDSITPAGTSPATPEALILAPTRELAIQIGNEANMYSSGSMIKTQIIYGGTATGHQKGKLIRGCNIMIATTGRLKQFMKEGVIKLNKVQFFILDEADRMLDMGFMPDVDEIVKNLPPKEERISGLFSATFPAEIQQAASKYLHEYIFIVIGVVGGACADVEQEFIQTEKKEKLKTIKEILKNLDKTTKALVFCASKKGADFLASQLSTSNISTTSIHGDRLQSQREKALFEFSHGVRQVLVATAVAARGLDIPKVGLVINYDLPNEIDEYVHRIGRTGRVGHTGKAISFYDNDQDNQLASKLVSILKGAQQSIPDFLSGAGGASCGDFDGGFNSVDHRGNMANGTQANGAANGGGGDDEDDW